MRSIVKRVKQNVIHRHNFFIVDLSAFCSKSLKYESNFVHVLSLYQRRRFGFIVPIHFLSPSLPVYCFYDDGVHHVT
jgi:hypothetical protein